jgi:hypothetical protein
MQSQRRVQRARPRSNEPETANELPESSRAGNDFALLHPPIGVEIPIKIPPNKRHGTGVKRLHLSDENAERRKENKTESCFRIKPKPKCINRLFYISRLMERIRERNEHTCAGSINQLLALVLIYFSTASRSGERRSRNV